MKVILVPVSNRPESATALRVATGLAERFGGNIVGCHLRPHREIDKDYKPRGLPLFGSANRLWLDELNAKSTKSAAQQAHKTFKGIVADAGFSIVSTPHFDATSTAIWQEKVGSPDRLMGILGPVSDLTIVTRPTPGSHVGRMFMLAALFHAGRPVLVLPQKQARIPGKRVAIAWNQSPEVSRVIKACMPILQAAEQVTVISAGPENRPGPKSAQLRAYLKVWGVRSKVLKTRGHSEQAELIGAYRDSKSDLLLMGAYSRARFREMVFGGMTDYMLTHTKIPLITQLT
jgi:nucleotide-binding universal stress UspA family protein